MSQGSRDVQSQCHAKALKEIGVCAKMLSGRDNLGWSKLRCHAAAQVAQLVHSHPEG